jgi:hypothetical protein
MVGQQRLTGTVSKIWLLSCRLESSRLNLDLRVTVVIGMAKVTEFNGC